MFQHFQMLLFGDSHDERNFCCLLKLQGPHLYAGAGLVVLWALAYSCVPAMQKGNDTARTIHIGANLAGIGLFGWQVVSGVPILFKVIEFTKWP